MKRFLFAILTLIAFTATAQVENSIVLDAKSFRAVQQDELTGVNIDPIGLDHSRQACARIKIKFDRMSKAQIDALEVKMRSNTDLTKQKVADYYDNVLILEMTAKPNTRFYFYSPEFGESNEVTLNLEGNREYEMLASLNQTFSIVVSSNAENVDIYLDDVFKGKTDSSKSLTIKEVMIGAHTLKAVYGTVSSQQSIEVNSGSILFRQNVDTAASRPQFVVFAVEPQSAVVTIEGKHYSLTDGAMRLVLESGTYNYTVSAAGYHSQSGTFTVAGSKVTKQIALTADVATVTLTVADNAEIWVNGEKVGNSRWSGTLNSGTYIFEAKKAGHSTTTTSKHITSDKPQQSYTLDSPKPLFGSLMIDGTPIMANVTIDGKIVGQLPLTLDNLLIGNHTVIISKSGYNAHTQTVTITEGKTATVNATLTKQTSQTPNSTSASSGKVYKVGDYYNENGKKGVVFEVSADGRSGKIVSMKQSSEELQWSSDSAEQKRLIGANSKTDGAANMAKVKAIYGWQSKYPAFKWCADLGEGWYLPSKEELHTIYKCKDKLNPKLTDKLLFTYWSSTEDDFQWSSGEFCAWSVFVYGGDTYSNNKHYDIYVRAVSAFGDSSKTESAATTVSNRKTSAPYKVGDYYNDGVKEGVVFDVSADGKSGKIVSMGETWVDWTTDGKEQSRIIGASSTTDGAYNMTVVKSVPDWEEKYPNFKWCANLGVGWYLPAIEELKLLILDNTVYNAVNRTLAANKGTLLANKETVSYLISYLSSTEENQKPNNEYKAWHVFVKFGYTLDLGKNRSGRARAVATFGDVSNWQQSISGVKTYKVGDYYNENGKQGVVIEVRDGGSHGKIVSMTQTELPWSDKSGQRQIIGANSNINGAYNMSIITAIPKWEEKYHAFKWCADLGEDWYLPTTEDLLTIYRNKKIINSKLTDKILDESYWSSREDSENKLCANFISMSNGSCMALGKVYYQYVRAVANF